MTENNTEKSAFIGSSYQFRIALKRIEILNGIFPDLYDSHREHLVEFLRKKIGIRDKNHQREIVGIIEKKIPNLMRSDELEQLEHMNDTIIWEVPELKKLQSEFT